MEETPRGPTLRGGFRGKCSEEPPASGVLLRGAFRASEQEPFFSQEPLALGAPLSSCKLYGQKRFMCFSPKREVLLVEDVPAEETLDLLQFRLS